MIQKATPFKVLFGEPFGKIVSSLTLCVYLDAASVVLDVIDVGPEEVEFDAPVLGSTGDFMIYCKT